MYGYNIQGNVYKQIAILHIYYKKKKKMYEKEILMIEFDSDNQDQKEFVLRVEKEASRLGMRVGFTALE